MASVSVSNLVSILLVSVFAISTARNCSDTSFSNKRVFISCIDLPYLEAHLHWNYIPSHRQVSIAYRVRQDSTGWIAWGINPTDTGMVGSQALIAFRSSNGSMIAYPTSVQSYSPSLLPGKLTFRVSKLSAEYANNEMTIYATVGPLKNGATVNYVWQTGSLVSRNKPHMHSSAFHIFKQWGQLTSVPLRDNLNNV